MGELRNKVVSYLQGHNAMSLATAHDGQAHAATVFYVNDHLDLYFISSPSSRHGQHLAANNHIAATVNEDYRNWNDIKGLQLVCALLRRVSQWVRVSWPTESPL